jgi:hypothetical protein
VYSQSHDEPESGSRHTDRSVVQQHGRLFRENGVEGGRACALEGLLCKLLARGAPRSRDFRDYGAVESKVLNGHNWVSRQINTLHPT